MKILKRKKSLQALNVAHHFRESGSKGTQKQRQTLLFLAAVAPVILALSIRARLRAFGSGTPLPVRPRLDIPVSMERRPLNAHCSLNAVMASVSPFKISVPQEKIDTLLLKLSLAQFPDELEASGWDLGSPLSDVKRLVKAWERFDWRQAEERLNQVPQYTTDIDVVGFGMLNIHFVHQTTDVSDAIPLLFVHGWPGSFIEVLKILPLLAHQGPGEPAFHVVAPSLPNFGFSQGVSKRGFAAAQYAEVCHKLMLQLGYNQYATQGGDWGVLITRSIGALYPRSCKASHINLVRSERPLYSRNPIVALQNSLQPYSEKEKLGFERTKWFVEEGSGYRSLQSTKPQTLAYSLQDSPVALLAWIYEKLHDWTDDYPWTDDEILTWISIYQFSRPGVGAAQRIYYEVQHTKQSTQNLSTPGRTFTLQDVVGYIKDVKLGITFNPKELVVLPKLWARTLGDVVYEAENDAGGHFYAHEHPELLARDLKVMFGEKGGAHGAVTGRDGYVQAGRARL